MKRLFIAPLALAFVVLTLSGCFFPGRYHDRYGTGYGGGYGHPEGPAPGPYIGGGGFDQRPGAGFHQGP